MNVPAVQLRDVTKDFPAGWRGLKVRAVDRLSFSIPEGSVYGLLGPNGSGKSTTIKLLLGLLRPSSGECLVFGRAGTDPAARMNVGFLPESPCFPRHLSGCEWVRFHGRICGLRGAALERRLADVIDLVGLSGAASRRIGTYSKGMLQRIGLAQALVHDPRLVLLDEPAAGLDPIGVEMFAKILRGLKARGRTVLLCSHLLSQVEELCDRVAVLNRGALVREGALADLLEEPGVDSFVVEGLDESGRRRVDAAVLSAGGRLRRVAPSRRRLHTLFLDAAGGSGKGRGR